MRSSFARLELSKLILIGLLLGVVCGLFFGEYCHHLTVLGDIWVGLLRMTVLPYICVTLVAGLGRLSLRDARRLATIGGVTLLILWVSALITVWLLPASFPEWKSGSFFSSALVTQADEPNLFDQFVPANVVESLANNYVPAIVVFCIFAGLALGKVKDADALLEPLDVIAKVLLGISKTIAKLAPIGIFAIAASNAGTVSLLDAIRLQAYLIAYTAGCLFLGVVVLPTLVTATTPVTYRQFWQVIKEPMITAFVTGKLIVVIPMLAENTERLLRDEPSDSGVEAELPRAEALYATAYPFPHVGKLLTMLFIPFTAWFLGNPLAVDEYPALLTSGLFAFFGGPVVAIPFQLDQMRLPHDMFQLFLLSGVYGERLGDAVGAVHLAALTLITSFGFRKSVQFDFFSLAKTLGVSLLFGAAIVGAARFALNYTVKVPEDRDDIIARMQLLDQPVESVVIRESTQNPNPLMQGESLLQRIRRRGMMRVGYNEDKVPFAFFNARGDLVGYDIDMAHALARDLGVKLEFVRFDRNLIARQLANDNFDVVMSGLVGTLERAEAMLHTTSYFDVNLALVTRDYRVRDFKTLSNARGLGAIRIGFVDLSRGFVERLQAALPNAELVEIQNNRDYFSGDSEGLDALLISAESGSAFSLTYPDFEVVIPKGEVVKLPLFYAIGQRDNEMQNFLEHWIDLRKKDGTAKEFYGHWILGKTPQQSQPRWSVIRDVLHWID